MIILSKSAINPSNIQPSEITSREVFDNRRQFIKAAGFGLVAGSALLLSAKARAATVAGGTTEGDGRLLLKQVHAKKSVVILKLPMVLARN
jgi:hypothetical protein